MSISVATLEDFLYMHNNCNTGVIFLPIFVAIVRKVKEENKDH